MKALLSTLLLLTSPLNAAANVADTPRTMILSGHIYALCQVPYNKQTENLNLSQLSQLRDTCILATKQCMTDEITRAKDPEAFLSSTLEKCSVAVWSSINQKFPELPKK